MLLFVLAAWLGPVAAQNPAHAQAGDAGPWEPYGWRTYPSALADQGVATVVEPGGRSKIVTRGSGSVPPRLRAQGWIHIGDPGSRGGYLLDAYQGAPDARAIMFLLTTPAGSSRELVHTLARGEQYNNSFAAIAPNARWFVSGGWGTMRRLLIFPMPRPGAGGRANLSTSGVIRLSRPVRDVQGCAFARAATLVCATNDPSRELFPVPQQLLRVQLRHPIDGHSVAARVTLLGEAPTPATCFGHGEVEGLDIYRSRLLVAVTAPCRGRTYLYRYVDDSVDHGSFSPSPAYGARRVA